MKPKNFTPGALLGAACSVFLLLNLAGCAGFSSTKSNSTPPPSLSITGTITPSDGGTAVTVSLSGATTATVTTDAFGNYVFSGIPGGNYKVTPVKSSYHFNPASQSMTLSSSGATGVNFTAAKGNPTTTYSISGTISPTNGNAVTVTLSGSAGATTTTDGSGNYSFSGIYPGSYTLTPSESQYTFAPTSQNVTISTANVTGVNFADSKVVTPTYSISGTVTPAANGSGATVTLSGAANATTMADSSGNYSFSGLNSGTYALVPSKSGFTFSPSSLGATITTSNVAGENFAATPIVAPTYSISGTITPAANGNGATVTLSGAANATTTADSSGNYSFSGLKSGSYALVPGKSGFTFSPSSLGATITTANITGENFTASAVVAPTFSISGAITPAANGGGATVTLSGAANATTTADSAGNYSFSGLKSGSYALVPSKSGFTFSPSNLGATITTSNITGENFTASPVVVPTYSISGTISPSTNGTAATVRLSGAANATTTADSSGNYSFSGLKSGTYTLTPNKTGFGFSPSNLGVTISTSNVGGENFTASPAIAGGVNIQPGDNIPNIVASNPPGTTFVIYPGTYRLTQSIVPKNGDSFIGQTTCAPPASPCPAILSGSVSIGAQAVFDGTNYRVTGQTQQGTTGATGICDSGWEGCIYPEDLFFDGVPYKHLYSTTLPAIGPGQWWFNYASNTIYFHDNPSGHTVETSVVNTAFNTTANNVNVQYLTIEEFASMYPNAAVGVFQGSTPQTSGANWTVQNSEILLNHGSGVRVGYGTQILNNYIHDNGQLGIGGGIGVPSAPALASLNANILVQGNTINHNDYAHFNPTFGSGGFKIGSTSGVTLRGNTIQNNEGSGIHFDVNSQNALVDGNTITDNSDGDGLTKEISYGTSTFRNNIVLRNGAQINDSNTVYQIGVHASSGVEAYCNVVEVPNGANINAWGVVASDRGSSNYPPYQYLVATGNSFHHNTTLWEAGSTGTVGYQQDDAAHQPNFFADNTAPDSNVYYPNSMSATDFIYDNNNSQSNTGQIFGGYQANGADVHGGIATNTGAGYPAVTITSPADQSSVTSPVAVTVSASDGSGISKVEYYVDWALQGTSTSSPYSYSWTGGTTGSHVVVAMAYSNAGVRSCYAVTVNEH